MQQPQPVLAGLKALKLLGVWGVTLPLHWSAVERAPRRYDWGGYRPIMALVREAGLKLQVSFCFHADARHALPGWVLEVGRELPDVFFADKEGNRCTECLSLGVDDVPILAGRTAVQCYSDLMAAFASAHAPHLGTLITDARIGLGPNGQLKYPAHHGGGRGRGGGSSSSSSSGPSAHRDHPTTNNNSSTGTNSGSSSSSSSAVPGVGEFQCCDGFMRASLAAAAARAGRPAWAEGGPKDAGGYTFWPHQTGFFRQDGGWRSEHGRWFTGWYSGLLVSHADRVLGAAAAAFAGSGVRLQAALPFCYWWCHTPARAAELTAGYSSSNDSDPYLPALSVFARHGVAAHVAAGGALPASPTSSPHTPAAGAPDALLLQVRGVAAAVGAPVTLATAGVNFSAPSLRALERAAFGVGCYQGVDVPHVDRIEVQEMGDAMFEPEAWTAFRDWAAQARRRAAALRAAAVGERQIWRQAAERAGDVAVCDGERRQVGGDGGGKAAAAASEGQQPGQPEQRPLGDNPDELRTALVN